MSELRLPWTKREGILYGCVIASISSFLIGGYNVYDSLGYDLAHIPDFLCEFIFIWPVMFLIAFTLANTVVGWAAGKVVNRYITPTDSVNTFLCFNLIMCVLLMSVILTFVGGVVGEGIACLRYGHELDIVALAEHWPEIWPRNFCIAFWVEMLIAQPAARMTMAAIHKKKMDLAEKA